MAQATIADFGAGDAEQEPSGADQEPSHDSPIDPAEFHRKIPEDEFTHVANGITERECVAMDVAPSAIYLIAGQLSVPHVKDRFDYRPDDQYREEQYSIEEEPDAVQRALANQHENHPTRE